MKADKQLTTAAGFADPRSYVAPDGSQILYGDDWLARKKELWERCGGFCEWRNEDNQRCSVMAADPHHVIRRSVKRIDNLWNLLALCRFHHDQMDSRKPRWSRGEAMRQAKGGS